VLPQFRSPTERFEVDGANAARDFLAARSVIRGSRWRTEAKRTS